MNKKTTLLLWSIFGLWSALLLAQKNITVEEIYNGTFRTKNMEQLHSMKNSNQYTVLQTDRNSRSSKIVLFDFATLKEVKTLVDTKNFSELKGIDAYTFNPSETAVLIANNTESIYRHSSVADYFYIDLATQKIEKIAAYKIQEPTFSPDGTKIAYAYQNNLYWFDLNTKQTNAITTNGKKNHIIHGITDWVYEEEFGYVRAFQWSNNSQHLAYISFDETEVPEFSMDVYGTGLYPTQEVFKYPKAGEKNAVVSLQLFTLANQQTKKIPLTNESDYYIARLQATNQPEQWVMQVLNRHQTQLKLVAVQANGSTKVLHTETDKAYVDVHDYLTFLPDHSFIWASEKDGWMHLYHHDANGKLHKQITKGNWDVTDYYGYDAKSKTIFYQSVERGSTKRHVYAIGMDGKKKRLLTPKTGNNKAKFSPNFSHFIWTHSSTTEPTSFALVDTKSGKLIQTIVENSDLTQKLQAYQLPVKEFITVNNALGQPMNAYIIKPKDFNPNKKYPLLLFQYSGPGSQQVNDQWMNSNDYWHMMLTQKGYIVACVDGRGTGYLGRDFKKVTQLQLGKYEVEDQIFAAKYFGNQPFIDAGRIGIWGWSYGGFMSSNCLLQGNDVFKMAIAVAPVTNWRFYDTIYTERYMQTPQENASGYDDNSPINHIQKLKGKYLIIHGTADDNVHVQNALRMIRALQLAGKDFDQAIYPDTNHGIYGGKIRTQLYQKMTDYILTNL